MDSTWNEWLNNWRTIAKTSDPTKYISIETTVDGKSYEVLRISGFHHDYDGDKAHVETSIRDFNDKTALLSEATRDLGIVRIITKNRNPTFLLEPGADVLKWRAKTEGVSARKLVEVMRVGDLGRRIQHRDRQAAKALHTAVAKGLKEKVENLEVRLKIAEAERDSALGDSDRMRKNLIRQNEKQNSTEIAPQTPLTMRNQLEKAQCSGIKLTSTKPLPGNFEG